MDRSGVTVRFLAVALCATLPLAACAGPVMQAVCRPAVGAVFVDVVDHGWHTDLGLPAAALTGRLAIFRQWFPGAQSFLFGFGKRTFFTAKVDSWQEYGLGPVPGPAAILVTGLRVLPDAAYGRQSVRLALPPGGEGALQDFLWRSLAHDRDGRPRLIAAGTYPGSLFYAATPTYWLGYTCNTWTADALHRGGVPLSPAGIVLAGQVMRRARHAAPCAAG